MIQRIQTVYLFLGAVALGALFGFASPWESTAAATYAWYEPALLVLTPLTAAGALGSIFMYDRRKKQRTAVVAVQGLTFVLAAVLYGGLYLTGELAVRRGGTFNVSKIVALLLPIVAYVFFLLARRGIDHDIELVKSMDRLR
jgi:hypothetical protein